MTTYLTFQQTQKVTTKPYDTLVEATQRNLYSTCMYLDLSHYCTNYQCKNYSVSVFISRDDYAYKRTTDMTAKILTGHHILYLLALWGIQPSGSFEFESVSDNVLCCLDQKIIVAALGLKV